jgi:UDP-N-acetylglucosamine:LPS N-acetylglucosamine transferase
VFATLAAGGGHVTLARAMAEAVDVAAPGAFDLEVSDLMLDLGFETLDARHKAQWRRMLAHPWSARWGQRIIDAFPGGTRRVLRRAFDGVARAAAERYADDLPALIVANHGFLAFALTRSRLRYGLRVPVVVVVAEMADASALWAEPEAERLIVATDEVRRHLVRLGVAAARIEVLGWPVRQAFLHAPPQAEARARLGLEDRFTCLLTFGGEGMGGQPEDLVAALGSLAERPQVVVIAGRNEELARALRGRAGPNVVVRGFVTDMAEHIAAADVVVGKAGPSSVMEAVAVGRPMLVTACAGLNEVRLLRYAASRGLGRAVLRTGALVDQVAAMMTSHAPPSSSARLAQAAAEARAGTARVGQALVTAATEGMRITEIATVGRR